MQIQRSNCTYNIITYIYIYIRQSIIRGVNSTLRNQVTIKFHESLGNDDRLQNYQQKEFVFHSDSLLSFLLRKKEKKKINHRVVTKCIINCKPSSFKKNRRNEINYLEGSFPSNELFFTSTINRYPSILLYFIFLSHKKKEKRKTKSTIDNIHFAPRKQRSILPL